TLQHTEAGYLVAPLEHVGAQLDQQMQAVGLRIQAAEQAQALIVARLEPRTGLRQAGEKTAAFLAFGGQVAGTPLLREAVGGHIGQACREERLDLGRRRHMIALEPPAQPSDQPLGLLVLRLRRRRLVFLLWRAYLYGRAW